jgi:hypothetical protein
MEPAFPDVATVLVWNCRRVLYHFVVRAATSHILPVNSRTVTNKEHDPLVFVDIITISPKSTCLRNYKPIIWLLCSTRYVNTPNGLVVPITSWPYYWNLYISELRQLSQLKGISVYQTLKDVREFSIRVSPNYPRPDGIHDDLSDLSRATITWPCMWSTCWKPPTVERKVSIDGKVLYYVIFNQDIEQMNLHGKGYDWSRFEKY